MTVIIHLTEKLTETLTPILFRLGAVSDPTDSCECLYLELIDSITFVFHLFT